MFTFILITLTLIQTIKSTIPYNHIEVLIPTLNSQNDQCKNASELYLTELKKLTLWATEMFDSTGKFPSGILYGSPYSLGNFDQCLDVRVPLKNDEFQGKYCLAKFTIHNIKFIRKYFEVDYQNPFDYWKVSAWEKVLAFYDDNSKASRNEIYFSFCLPSHCTHDDLKQSLIYLIKQFNLTNFEIDVKIDENNCQIAKSNYYSFSDFMFTIIIFIFVLIVIMCSIWDFLVKKQCLGNYKPSGNFFKFIKCFSLPANVHKLTNINESKDNMDFIAGLKVISMFLIIMGHRCMFTFGSPLINPKFLEQTYTKIEAMMILNGPIIVDTFFTISGFLSSYFVLKTLKKNSNILNIFKIYLHRLVRILPVYCVVLGFYATVFQTLGTGPFWQERVGVERERCAKNWWTNIVFINNYFNFDEICMFQSWYITCDMHYFLIVPLLVIIIQRKPAVGISLVCMIIVGSVATILVTVYNNYEQGILLLYPNLLRDPITNRTFQKVYIPSHMRATPYFIGVLTGILKYNKMPSKLNKHFNMLLWVFCVIVSMVTIHSAFIFYSNKIPKMAIIHATYAAFHHLSFSACIAYVIISLSLGKVKIVGKILGWKPLIFLARLTYTAFLCHGAVQLYTAGIMRSPSYSGVFPTLYQTAGDIVMAFIFGFFLSMCFEAPIIGFEKLILGGKVVPDNNNRESSTKPEV